MKAMDAINNKNGRGTLRVASQGAIANKRSKREKLSPQYTTKWSDILKIGD